MPVTINHIDANTVRLDIEIPSEDVESAFDRELRKQRGQMRLRGFRPGKAPLSLIKGYVGDQVLAEVTSDLMQSSLLRAVEEHDMQIVGPPKLDRSPQKRGEPIRFSAVFEVHEKPREVDLDGLKAERRVARIEEATVDEQLDRLRELHAQSVPIEPPRPARKGDQARLDYELRFDDKPDDEPLRREGLEIEVGEAYVMDELVQALDGMSVGEEKTVAVEFPANHRATALAGRKGQVHLKLVDLALRKLPALDDEFARDVGEADLGALRAKVRAELEAEARRQAEGEVEQALIEQVLERARPSLPAGWLEEQYRERIAAFERTFGGGRELPAAERESLRTDIEHGIRRAVVIGWLVRQLGAAARDEQLEKRLQEIAEKVGKPLPAVKAEFAKKGYDALQVELAEANVLAALRERATITDASAAAAAPPAAAAGSAEPAKPAESAKAAEPSPRAEPAKTSKRAKPAKTG